MGEGWACEGRGGCVWVGVSIYMCVVSVCGVRGCVRGVGRWSLGLQQEWAKRRGGSWSPGGRAAGWECWECWECLLAAPRWLPGRAGALVAHRTAAPPQPVFPGTPARLGLRPPCPCPGFRV